MHGDIHPNPGPRKKVGLKTCDVKILNMNVQSSVNAWKLLDDIDHTTEVILLQEIRMPPNEVIAFERAAYRKGFYFHTVAGVTSTGRWKETKQNGGVATLICRKLQQKVAFKHCTTDGQLLGTWIGDTLVCNTYARPCDVSDDFFQPLFDLIISHPHCRFLCVGDWNMTPQENHFFHAMQPLRGWLLAGQSDGVYTPTRWAGNRCIDYAVTNLAVATTKIHLTCAKYGDHKLLEMRCQLSKNDLSADKNSNNGILIPTCKYRCPDGVAQADWDSMVNTAWDLQNWTKPTDIARDQAGVDLYWQKLCNAFENAFQTAYVLSLSHDFLNLPSKFAAGTRPKGSCPKIKQSFAHKSPYVGNTSHRQIRNAIGRLLELQRIVQCDGWTHQALLLREKVNRIFPQGGLTLQQWHAQLCQTEKDWREAMQKDALETWRRKLQADDREMFKWIRTKSTMVTSNLFHKNQPDIVSNSMTQAFDFIESFWKSVRSREKPSIHEMKADWDLSTFHLHAAPQEWLPLTPADISKHISRLKHSSAGLDGWDGPEIAALTVPMIYALTDFYNFMESAGCCPTLWLQIRQTHIPKPKGFRASDNACDVAALRPISVTSIFWRLWGSTRMKHDQTIAWVDSWCPSNMHAGKRKRGCYTALHEIFQATEKGHFLASLDYSLAFDCVSPTLATHAFARLGMPSNIANVLTSMWTNQQRYLQLLGHTHLSAQHVDGSLLQGDAWSMIALNAVLLAPLLDTQVKCPDIEQVLYVDDRTITSKSLDSLSQAIDNWTAWSRKLGLVENRNKMQLFQNTEAGFRAICEAGFQDVATKSPTVLGASFAGRKIRKINDFEKRKVEKAEQVAMKCKYLPTSPDRNLRIATVTAGGQARYGWALRRPNITTFKGLKKIYSQIAREHSHASPDLRTLFRGHMADPRFMCSLDQITAAYRAAATSNQPPLPWNSKGPRFRLLIAALREYGWHTDSPWVFSHPKLDLTISLDPAHSTFPECQPALEHALRESWRCSLFSAWKRSKRRDAHACKDIEYNSERCRLARLAARDRDARVIMSGGFISPLLSFLFNVEVVVLPTPPLVRNELPVIKPSPNAHFVVTMKLALITWFGSVMQDITLFHGIYLANLNAP